MNDKGIKYCWSYSSGTETLINSYYISICILGSQLEDIFWSWFRTTNTKLRSYYNPHLEIFLGPIYMTYSMYNEYFVKRIYDHIQKVHELSVTEEEQVIMRALCNLQSGT